MLRSLVLRSIMIASRVQRTDLPRVSWRAVGALVAAVPPIATLATRR